MHLNMNAFLPGGLKTCGAVRLEGTVPTGINE